MCLYVQYLNIYGDRIYHVRNSHIHENLISVMGHPEFIWDNSVPYSYNYDMKIL